MLGIIKDLADNKQSIYIEFDSPVSFKTNQPVKVTEHKKNRSLSQNRLYFGFLKWCISREGGGLIDQGHFAVDGLHADVKAWIQSEYPNQFDFKQIFSSAELNTKQFTDFIELVDRELMCKFFGIDSSVFWGEVNKGELPF
jgi:hypothetical protein